jgi:hypothetical protein
MKKYLVYFYFALLLSSLMLTAACGKTLTVKGIFTETERIVLEGGGEFNRLFSRDNGFVGLNWSDASLCLFDKSGRLLDSYRKEGAGPGEYNKNSTVLLGIFEDLIFVGAMDRSALLVFEARDGTIRYKDEYPIDEGGLRGGAVDSKGNIWVALQGGAHEVAVLSPLGEILQRYLPAEEKDREISPEKLIKSLKWLLVEGDTAIFISYMTYQVHIFKSGEKSLYLSAEAMPQPVFVENNYEMKTTGNSINLTGQPGVKGYALVGDTLYMNLLTDDENTAYEKSIVHAFSVDGENRGLFECRFARGEMLDSLAGTSADGEILAFPKKDEEKRETVLCVMRPEFK